MSDQYHSIRAQYQARRQAGQVRHRDVAGQLGLSEGELIAAHVGGAAADGQLAAVRLQAGWPQLMAELEALGEVMALTRNASCVHEKVGVYRHVSVEGEVGLVLGGAIDLRVFYRHWAHGFAVSETTKAGVQRSLQFFDATGTAIHKVFLKPQSDVAAYAALVTRHADAAQAPGLCALPAAPVAETADAQIDAAGLRRAWSELRDTHDFFGLLKRFGVTRTQGLRLADPRFVQQVEAASAHQLLESAARDGVAIMVFVGNPGMIQIHTGHVKRIAVMGPWINVLDPGFNLHLREDHIASAWVVRKPTVDGLVTSLELFDADGRVIAMLFGERKPGRPELCEWRSLIDNLLEESTPCAG